MQNTLFRVAGAAVVAASLSACAPGANGTYGMPAISPDGQRALIGAGAGAVAAKAFDGNVTKGALAGAAVGALCDDVGMCQPTTGY